MRNFLKSEAYYLKKDSTTKGISLLFIVASIMLVVYVGKKGGFSMANPLQPLSNITQLSLFFYFIIPIHACFFSTEGFEYGSIKNIIAGGQSRTSYVLGKFLAEIKMVIWWLLQFFGSFYALYMVAALVTGSNIGMNGLSVDLSNVLSVLSLNLLYLTAYVSVVLMVGLVVRKTASAAIITLAVVFGDFMVSGYLKASSFSILRTISNYTMTTQIMKFSGIYVANGKRILLSGMNEYLNAVLVPVIIIGISLTISLISFRNRDIHV